MATTYTLISSNVLSGSATSVTFSSIPSTYTDLVLRISARGTSAGLYVATLIRLNNDSSAIYSITSLYAQGTTVGSQRGTGATSTSSYLVSPSGGTTANTFGNAEVYIPSYLASQNKPFSVYGVTENNSATNNEIDNFATLYKSTTAINRIDVIANGTTFDVGSSFYLYGIKNS